MAGLRLKLRQFWEALRAPLDTPWRIRWGRREWVCPLSRQRAIILHVMLALIVVIASIQMATKVTPPESPMTASIQATLIMAPNEPRQSRQAPRWSPPPERPVERAIERPVEKPIERNIERPVERPTPKPVERFEP